MKSFFLLIYLILLLSLLGADMPAVSGKIIITAEGFKNNKGIGRAALYNSSEGFPNNPSKAYKLMSGKIQNKTAEFIFSDVPVGDYAISILHDENMNSRMDTGFLGIPKEGYGFSNNAIGSFGPPKFEDAKFVLSFEESTSNTLKIKIIMHY